MSSSITIHSNSKYFDVLHLYNIFILSDKLSTGHQFTVHSMAHSILDSRHIMFKIMLM